MSTGSLQYSLAVRQNGSIDQDLSDVAPQSFHKAVLYVLGEKSQMRVGVGFCLKDNLNFISKALRKERKEVSPWRVLKMGIVYHLEKVFEPTFLAIWGLVY